MVQLSKFFAMKANTRMRKTCIAGSRAEEILFGDTDNLFVARARHCLGNIQRQDGHYEEAANYLNKLCSRAAHLRREHVEVAEIMDDLAKVRRSG